MVNPVAHVEASIRSRNLLKRGQGLLVGVSGGLDSMVLLQVLHDLASLHRWRITVAHLNHQLRGRSSQADEALVVNTSRILKLPVICERIAVRERARVQKLSLEMAGRNARHDFLARTAIRLNIRTIALAHHADDQLELFFLRLLRGSGSEGLAGMKWRGPSPANTKLEIIRPLLDLPKSVLREFAATRQIRFREDASNASLDFQRNRIRHELLPLLRRRYQPALGRVIARVMEIVAEESALVGKLGADWLSARDRPAFRHLPVAVQRRGIQIQLRDKSAGMDGQNLPVDFDLIEQLRTKPGQWVEVSPESTVSLDGHGQIHWRANVHRSGPISAQKRVKLSPAGAVEFGGRQFRWRIVSGAGRVPGAAKAGGEVFDADAVGAQVVLRHWRPGDRFQPSGMKSPVKLQDLFVNGKVPRARRHQLVVATTATGKVFWVEKLRIAERFKLTSRTIRRLHWRWKPL